MKRIEEISYWPHYNLYHNYAFNKQFIKHLRLLTFVTCPASVLALHNFSNLLQSIIMYSHHLTNLSYSLYIPFSRKRMAPLHCYSDLIINQADLLSMWIMKLSLGKPGNSSIHLPSSPRLDQYKKISQRRCYLSHYHESTKVSPFII